MNINEAAELNDIDALRQMIGASQDINRFSRGMAPLMAAAANSSTEAVMLLIKMGARLDLADKAGTTSLMFAAMHGYERIVRLIIDSGADLDICDKKGYCALLHAILANNAPVMSVLLERGANPNAALPNGKTALDIALGSGFVKATNILMSFAADVTRTLAMHSRKSELAAKWFQETVPLLSAVESEDLSKVRELLSAGISPNAQDKKGETALIRAARQGSDDIVQELINFGADINGTAEDGWTPLSQAVVKGHISTICYLGAHGADLTAKSRAGVSILDLAASTGRETVIHLIISMATEQGAILDVRQAAEVAVRHGYEGAKSVLLQS